MFYKGFPGSAVIKNLPASARDARVQFLGQEALWRRKRQGTPVFLLGEFHGQRNLAGYSPQVHKESDMTKYTNTCFII